MTICDESGPMEPRSAETEVFTNRHMATKLRSIADNIADYEFEASADVLRRIAFIIDAGPSTPPAASRMTSMSNEMLTALHKFWEWEADWMTCRACRRHLIASREDEPFVHADGCKNGRLVHPWQSLRAILCSTDETPAPLCPHGMPLAENTCGPCSQGKPNRPRAEPQAPLLGVLREAYLTVLREPIGVWRITHQALYCQLRDAIAEIQGRDPESVQNQFEDDARRPVETAAPESSTCYCGEYGGGVHTKSSRCSVETEGSRR